MLRLGFLGLVALTLAGCGPAGPAHDKAYYLAHVDERGAMLERCHNDPGGLGKSANCVNAMAAAGAVESSRFWDVKKPRSRVENPSGL
ncbi:MAG: EexN family lipoprotein [Caulobacter sp.]|nr:EexN family lipoprotein [Caulobacter sp.]